MATAGLTFAASLLGQTTLRNQREPLTPSLSPTALWRIYRWSPDPNRRREAALLMAPEGTLSGQGWGDSPLAAVSLLLAAEAAEQRGDQAEGERLWRQLLKRFPEAAVSARARQRFPEHHEALLSQQPAHPAALATAVAVDADGDAGLASALHLARWGWRWPGARRRIQQACISGDPPPHARQRLAWALGMLGDASTALTCLQGSAADPDTALAIGRSLLQGDRDRIQQGEALLLDLIRQQPDDVSSDEAVRLLMSPLDPDPDLIEAIPEATAQRTAAVAAARVRRNGGQGTLPVLKRWPNDRDSWQLQWDEARQALLDGRWQRARTVLTALPLGTLPGPLEARRRFWLGFSADRTGDASQARQHWQQLVQHHPPGYYRWRAAVHLRGERPLKLRHNKPTRQPLSWSPLNSRFEEANTLWRLGLNELAWDSWLSRRQPDEALPPSEQLVEGRLRLSVDDPWHGLDQLWRLSVRWASPPCSQRQQLVQSQNLRLYNDAFETTAQNLDIRAELLLAIAKQESRFTPTIRSYAGAIGLMQLMPATAASLSEQPLTEADLMSPELSIRLGAEYLAELRNRWNGDPYRVIASYNAGPTTVASWPAPDDDGSIELWVERIPYPETRYYTKKVLDNLLRYSDTDLGFCEQGNTGMGQQVTERNTTEQNASKKQHRQARGGANADSDEVKPRQEQR